jgi:hypothetical protein
MVKTVRAPRMTVGRAALLELIGSEPAANHGTSVPVDKADLFHGFSQKYNVD